MSSHQLRIALFVILFAVNKDSLVAADATTTEVGHLVNQSQPTLSSTSMYAWSAWGPWSTCSRSCGGGVSVQERHCLPRDPSRMRRSRKRRKLHPRSTINRSRRAIITTGPDCPGLGRRYHECNTAPCPGNARDTRQEQCSVYDRRPFRGQFYSWVPYVDGNAPCVLNCRPRGQQFYARLALVADGTPCTRPGYRAICVQGACKVVGRDGVLSLTSSKELRCGHRLVSGLFSRPRLPLGYTYVATIPRGACQVNISETEPSDNYIALKVVNGSSIINGEFAVSAPGTYEAAGTRFKYSRAAGLDIVSVDGPLQGAIDIMILYTRSKPNIKYEFMTDIFNKDEDNEIPIATTHAHRSLQRHHRHHAESHTKSLDSPSTGFTKTNTDLTSSATQLQTNIVGTRKFMWKILSFTPCSRTCGGGLQIGKFRCVETGSVEDKEVSPAHCRGSPPATRRRRCGGAPCPARWRSTAWGPCAACGPAHRTRLVGCVQDHAKGITKISNQKCPLPMPASSELCNVPNCDGTVTNELSNVTRVDARRQVRPQEKIDAFKQGPVFLRNSSISDITTTTTEPSTFSFSGASGWLYTEWSECLSTCLGGSVQTRSIRCSEPTGCNADRAPSTSQACHAARTCEPQWFTSEWSACSAKCGGRQVRGVLCLGSNGRRVRDNACNGARPEAERECGARCAAAWYLSDWSECHGPCEAGVQTRTVWCASPGIAGHSGAAKDSDCTGLRPAAKRVCVPPRCSSRPSDVPDNGQTAKVGRVAKTGRQASSSGDVSTRQTRQQTRFTQNTKKPYTPALGGECRDKLTTCALAVQARLCNYPYYAEYCCGACRPRR